MPRPAPALLAATALLTIATARAEVATDGTLGRKVRLTGKEVEVGAELGQRRGRNLFHSFERFGVEAGGRVTFTGPNGIKNVISRVTGGEASRIDGTLASRVSGADVYLVNPAGVVFGPGARLDVPGSFHASTADELRFEDGAAFSALDPGGSVLSVAAPESFGFLGGAPQPVVAAGAVLSVPQGETLALVGGDVGVLGSGMLTLAGEIRLAAAGGPGTVPVAGDLGGTGAGGLVLVNGGSLLSVSGEGGGTLRVRTGRLVVAEGSSLFSGTGELDAAAPGVVIEAGTVQVAGVSASGTPSTIASNALGGGRPGSVLIRAGALSLTDGGRISGDTAAGGAGADLVVEAGQLLVSGGGALESNTLSTSAPTARAGTVAVRAREVTVDERGRIASSALGAGTGGAVLIEAERVRIAERGTVSSAAGGAGAAGAVRIAAGRITIEGDDTGVLTSTIGGGRAGDVVLAARDIVIRDGGVVDSSTGGAGPAGSVRIAADDLAIRSQGQVSTNTGSGGDAGEIVIGADRLTIEGDGPGTLTGISSAAVLGTGRAGNVTVEAEEISLDRGVIATLGTGAEGGRVRLQADELIALRRSDVTSSGIVPQAGASVITLEAPFIALNDSRVTSLTGTGEPLTGSGEASLLGDATVISDDSLVAASSSVVTTGLQTDLGSDLQVSAGAFLDAESLLGASCAARRSGAASSFTRAGKGGLPPSPDRPLASGGGERLRTDAVLTLAQACDG